MPATKLELLVKTLRKEIKEYSKVKMYMLTKTSGKNSIAMLFSPLVCVKNAAQAFGHGCVFFIFYESPLFF